MILERMDRLLPSIISLGGLLGHPAGYAGGKATVMLFSQTSEGRERI